MYDKLILHITGIQLHPYIMKLCMSQANNQIIYKPANQILQLLL